MLSLAGTCREYGREAVVFQVADHDERIRRKGFDARP